MHHGHRVSAIVNCAGKGTRFGSNKLLVELGGMTVLEKTVRAMNVPALDELIVTVSEENEPLYRRILIEDAGLPVTLVVGGAERHISAHAVWRPRPETSSSCTTGSGPSSRRISSCLQSRLRSSTEQRCSACPAPCRSSS